MCKLLLQPVSDLRVDVPLSRPISLTRGRRNIEREREREHASRQAFATAPTSSVSAAATRRAGPARPGPNWPDSGLLFWKGAMPWSQAPSESAFARRATPPPPPGAVVFAAVRGLPVPHISFTVNLDSSRNVYATPARARRTGDQGPFRPPASRRRGLRRNRTALAPRLKLRLERAPQIPPPHHAHTYKHAPEISKICGGGRACTSASCGLKGSGG